MRTPLPDRNDLIAFAARYMLGAFALTAAAVVLGRAFVGSMGVGLVQPEDDAMRSWTQAHLVALTVPARWLGAVGSTPAMIVAAAVISLWLWISVGDFGRSVVPALSVAMAGGVGAVTKVVVGRPRPSSSEAGLLEKFSFPSGHTLAMAALATSLFLLWRSARGQRRPWWPGVAAPAAAVVGMALSRVVIDAHWATDVVAATVIGAGAATLVWRTATVILVSPQSAPAHRPLNESSTSGRATT